MKPQAPQHWLLLALGVAACAGIFMMWLQPGVVRSLLDASIGMWCS